jgi:hypothetical protein
MVRGSRLFPWVCFHIKPGRYLKGLGRFLSRAYVLSEPSRDGLVEQEGQLFRTLGLPLARGSEPFARWSSTSTSPLQKFGKPDTFIQFFLLFHPLCFVVFAEGTKHPLSDDAFSISDEGTKHPLNSTRWDSAPIRRLEYAPVRSLKYNFC